MQRIREAWGWVEVRVVLLVLVLLVGAEVALRETGSALSGDVEHLRQIDEITARVASAPGPSVLLWGNSLIAAGIDLEPLRAALSAQLGVPVAVDMVRPDGTTPIEWHYGLRKNVLDRSLPVDVLVIGFGPGHLVDRSARFSLDRLAAHHVSWNDVPELFASDLPDLEGRTSFLLSHVSTAHSLGDRIRDRALVALVPGYERLARELLAAPGAPATPTAGPAAGASGPRRTYRHAEELLAEAAAAGIRIVGVPMPAPRAWSLEPEEASAFAAAGAVVLDVRDRVPLPPERFPDGQHLDEVGRAAFTAALAPALAGTIGAALR